MGLQYCATPACYATSPPNQPSTHPATASCFPTHPPAHPSQVERQITNQTYILRLHVTTQMAQLLFPPRAELEVAHQAAATLEPPPPTNSRLGGGSTYTQLFKQRLTIVDESNRAWPVQVGSGYHGLAGLSRAQSSARQQG